MKTKIKRILSAIIVLCLTVSILSALTSITENKNSIKKYAQFFSQDADFDVLFMGNSRVLNGVLPMELWNDYGMVSYNMGGHANTLPTTYWVLRNALDYTTPKCVVIDCAGYGGMSYISTSYYYTHLSFDAFPLSVNKIRGVFDLIRAEEVDDVQARRGELLWNFSTYHSRWSTLERNDFEPSFTYQKGAEPRVNVSVPADVTAVATDERLEIESLGKEYLIKMITMCQERGIDVLLMYLPVPADQQTMLTANSIQTVAEEYGVEYLNFLSMDLVDFQTDMHDPDAHLNPLGARKVTGYLGKILREEYEIPDRRGNADYRTWMDDAEKYAWEKLDLLAVEASEKNIWMLLTDTDYSFVAEIRGSIRNRDLQTRKLMESAGIKTEVIPDHGYVVVDRAEETVMYVDYASVQNGPVDTGLGILFLQENAEGISVMLNDKVLWEAEADTQPDLTAAVFDYEKQISVVVHGYS